MSQQKLTYTEALAAHTEAMRDLSIRLARLEKSVSALQTMEAVQEEKFVSGRTVLIWIGASVSAAIGIIASVSALKH